MTFHAKRWLRIAAAALVVAMAAGCAHRAVTTSVNRQHPHPVALGSMEFVFVPAQFEGDYARNGALAQAGYYSGAFSHALGQTVKGAFKANGIDVTVLRPGHASSLVPPPYRMMVRPVALKVHTYGASSWTSLEIAIRLHQSGVREPIWTGTESLNITATRMQEVTFGNLALSILNALQTSGVAALPQAHAVSPKGNSNYMLDVPTALEDASTPASGSER